MFKNLLSSAGDGGLIRDQGTKTPHAVGQPSSGTTTREKPKHRNETP